MNQKALNILEKLSQFKGQATVYNNLGIIYRTKGDLDNAKKTPSAPIVPDWLRHCAEPRRRTTLFIAGAALILNAFVCFAPAKKKTTKNVENY